MADRNYLLTALALLAVSAPVATGQTAQITGRISDATGAVIPEADVVARNTGTGLKYATRSNDVGYYTLALLPPGNYELAVHKTGFRPVVRTEIRLEVNQVLRLNFQLEVGTAVESIEVRAEPPLLNLSDATVGKVIAGNSIRSLPLNGRNALSLVVLTPNVRFNASSPAGFADRGSTLAVFQVNGGPPGANNVELDGTTNINSRLGDINVNPGVDAVEEFKVQSGVVPADTGFTLGVSSA